MSSYVRNHRRLQSFGFQQVPINICEPWHGLQPDKALAHWFTAETLSDVLLK